MRNQNKMKWLYLISGFLFLGATLVSGFLWQSAGLAGVFGVVGIILMFFGNLDKFTEFSYAGFSGKTRDLIKQTENTLSELQSLAIIVAKATLSLVKRSGRMGGYGDDEEEKLKKDLLVVLEEIGIPKDRYAEALQDWHQLTKFDYVHVILGIYHAPVGFDTEMLTERKDLSSIEDLPTPDRVREFLTKWGVLTPDREEWIRDYEHYIEKGEHRRPEKWKDRDSLGALRKN